MLLRSESALTSLKRAAEECKNHSEINIFTTNLVGVIIDTTRPLYRQRDKDWIVQVRIIDETINQTSLYGIITKYCSAYLFAPNKQDLQLCNKIGQIVYLESFSYTLWNMIKLQTRYAASIQKFYTLDVIGKNVQTFFRVSVVPDKGEILHQDVINRAINLKQWFLGYFYTNYKPILGIHQVNNFCVMAQPFNMILQVINIQSELQQKSQKKHKKTQKFMLTDSYGNVYYIIRLNLPAIIPHNCKYFMVRNIKYIGNFYQLILTETGYVLGLPIQFQEQYKKDMNYCAISRYNEKFLLKNHKTCNLSKINYVAPRTTPIIQLLNNIDLYETKFSQRQDLRVQDLYMIEAVAINFTGKLRMFHKDHQMIVHDQFTSILTQDQKKQLIEQSKLAYLYQGVLGVLDRSSEATGKLFYVHLFSNQQRSLFFDSQIIQALNKCAGQIVNKPKERQVQQLIEQKLKSLIKRSDFTNTISMLLQPIKSDILIYRLTNTVFL